jgi:hypothetical protein
MGDTERSRGWRIMDIMVPILATIILSLIGLVWGSTSNQIRDLEKKSDAAMRETSELKAHREDDSKRLDEIIGELRYIRAKLDNKPPR